MADSAAERASGRRAAPAADGAGGRGPYWDPGSQILWRYRANDSPRPHICRPVTVVRDTPELLAVWMAPGTECIKPVLADGTPISREPLGTRYTTPRTTVRAHWAGTGVLKLVRPQEAWSVWLFWRPGWQFKNWYVNLEEPYTRWEGGIDSEDHFLDITVAPDGEWQWEDEDEFAQAQRDGLMGQALAERVQEAGRLAVESIRAWDAPYCDGWEDWRPDRHWPVPRLPEDWDRPPRAAQAARPSVGGSAGVGGGTTSAGDGASSGPV